MDNTEIYQDPANLKFQWQLNHYLCIVYVKSIKSHGVYNKIESREFCTGMFSHGTLIYK